ncbi:hypothetical protein S40293_10562 [Stachybotrys chartarum IBT 40293]|nr:hypothetical protein S40293_10562 [Stachybotrys chartarum IBT 40293]
MESMPWEREPLEGGGCKYHVFPEEPQTGYPGGAYSDEWMDSGEEASDQEDQCILGNEDDAHQWGRSSVAPLPSTTSPQGLFSSASGITELFSEEEPLVESIVKDLSSGQASLSNQPSSQHAHEDPALHGKKKPSTAIDVLEAAKNIRDERARSTGHSASSSSVLVGSRVAEDQDAGQGTSAAQEQLSIEQRADKDAPDTMPGQSAALSETIRDDAYEDLVQHVRECQKMCSLISQSCERTIQRAQQHKEKRKRAAEREAEDMRMPKRLKALESKLDMIMADNRKPGLLRRIQPIRWSTRLCVRTWRVTRGVIFITRLASVIRGAKSIVLRDKRRA